MEEFVSPKEVCKLLKVSKTWPYKMAKRGLLPHYKFERVVRFRKSDIDAFLEKARVEAREKKVGETKNKDHSSEPKQTTVDQPHSSEPQQTAGVCRRCRKRADGKIDYLINGLCGTCRPRKNLAL